MSAAGPVQLTSHPAARSVDVPPPSMRTRMPLLLVLAAATWPRSTDSRPLAMSLLAWRAVAGGSRWRQVPGHPVKAHIIY